MRPELLHRLESPNAFDAVAELEALEPGWVPATLTRQEAELVPRPVCALVFRDGRRAILARLPAAEGPAYGVWTVSL